MNHPIFGYGSLVHPDTRSEAPKAQPAILRWWRRSWAHRERVGGKPTSVLTVRMAPGSEILGVVLSVPDAYFPTLEKRETGYQRAPVLPFAVRTKQELPCETYVGDPARRKPPEREAPIWRSYLNCVLAGFYRLGGDEALDDFVYSTDDWGPILDDARAPNYIRHVALSPEESGAIDRVLARTGLRRHLFSPD